MTGLLRLLLYVSTTILFAFAILLSLGRVATWYAKDLTTNLNEYLVDFGIHGSELIAGWHLINPYISVGSVVFDGGSVTNLHVEIDVLKSLLRNELSIGVLKADFIEVNVVHTTDGWQLDGAVRRDQNFDLLKFVRNTDLIDVDAVVTLTRGTTTQEFQVSLGSIRQLDTHSFRVSLRSENACDLCSLEVSFDSGVPSQFDDILHISIQKLPINGSLLGLGENRLVEINAQGAWHNALDLGSGIFDYQVTTDLDPETLALVGRIEIESDLEQTRGRIVDSEIRLRNEGVTLPTTHLVWEDGSLHAWTPSINIGSYAKQLATLLRSDTEFGEVLARLNLAGQINDLSILFENGKTSFSAIIDNYRNDVYSNLPTMRLDTVTIGGTTSLMRVRVADGTGTFHVSPHFQDAWTVHDLTADMIMSLSDGRFSLNLDDSRLTYQNVLVDASLVYTRDLLSPQYSFLIDIQSVESIARLDLTSQFLPVNLNADVRSWIQSSVLGGEFSNIDVTYSQTRNYGMTKGSTRVELKLDFDLGVVRYEPSWPEIINASGDLILTEDTVLLNVGNADSWNIHGRGITVEIPLGQGFTRINGSATADMNSLLSFVRNSPLSTQLKPVNESWSGNGVVDIELNLLVSLSGKEPQPGDFQIDLRMDDATLLVEDLNLEFSNLNGRVNYVFPYELSSSKLVGDFYSQPVAIELSSEGSLDALHDTLNFALYGEFKLETLEPLLGFDVSPYANGSSDFAAVYTLRPESANFGELTIQSNLLGIEIDLAEPLSKERPTANPLTIQVSFDDATSVVHVESETLNGWLNLKQNVIANGFLAIGRDITTTTPVEATELILTGSIRQWQLKEDASENRSTIPLRFDDFHVDELLIGEFPLHQVVLSGRLEGRDLDIDVRAREGSAHVHQSSNGMLELDIDELRWLSSNSPKGQDPITPDVMASLPTMRINLDKLLLIDPEGLEDDFGEWHATVTKSDTGVMFTDFDAIVKGMHIQTTDEHQAAAWSEDNNTSEFEASVNGTDLSDSMRAWNYDLDVESSQFEFTGKLNWPGSPLSFDLKEATGNLTADLRDGRIVDIDEMNPAVRLAGLLSFSAIAKRLEFNFDDVVRKGFVFDRILVDATLDDGLLSFENPMTVKGAGATFNIDGSVDLKTGQLNIDLIATLTLNNSLPWYAAYLTLANPATSLAVIIGSQTFGSGFFNTLSSSSYKITGTLDEPKFQLAAVMETSIDENDRTKGRERAPERINR